MKNAHDIEWLDIGKRVVAITILSILIGLVIGVTDTIFGRTLIFLLDSFFGFSRISDCISLSKIRRKK